jgi:hypothetical protein
MLTHKCSIHLLNSLKEKSVNMKKLNSQHDETVQDDLDLSDIFSESGSRYILPNPFKGCVKENHVKYENAELLVKKIGQKILDGERFNVLLSGNFIFGDFFEAFAVETNSLIDELQISTLSLSKDNVGSLHNLIQGDYLLSLGIIVSDYWWSRNQANTPYIYEQLDIGNKFQLAVAGTNTKISLIRIGEKKIVISGSANLCSSRCLEQIQIETNPDLFDFHYDWQAKILEKYGTIKKPLRYGLFDFLTDGMTQEQIKKQQKSFEG